MTYISSGEGGGSGKKMTPKNTDMKEKHLAHGAEGWCRPGAVPLCACHSPHHARVAFCISSKDKPKPGVDRGTSLFPPRLSKCAQQCDSTICRSQGCPPPRHPSPRAGPLSSAHTLCLPSSSHEPAEGPARDAFRRSQSTRDVPGNAARRRDSEKPDRALETGSHESSFSVTGQRQTLSRGHFREHARPTPTVHPPTATSIPWQRRGLIRRGCT